MWFCCERSVELYFLWNYLSKRVDDSNANRAPFELNMLAAVAFRVIGCGYSF